MTEAPIAERASLPARIETPLRVLVACEFSGVVRDAFAARGHFAVSCDLLPCERSHGLHILGDVRSHLRGYQHCNLDGPQCDIWDLMIAHPPCTYFANSGVRWFYDGGKKTRNTASGALREQHLERACEFFATLLDAPIRRICIENPIPHRYALEGIGDRKYDQIIQPWQFGHGETKATCLWLKNLPKLVPTNIVEGRTARVHREPPGPDRWKNRSRTLPGIAEAMAEQWGGVVSIPKQEEAL